MVKVDTDGSGVGNVIKGCPSCDHEGTSVMRYHCSSWFIDPNMSGDSYSFRIKHCPFCGIELPLLDGWVLSQNDGTGTAKD
jgi:hypothetical protein